MAKKKAAAKKPAAKSVKKSTKVSESVELKAKAETASATKKGAARGRKKVESEAVSEKPAIMSAPVADTPVAVQKSDKAIVFRFSSKATKPVPTPVVAAAAPVVAAPPPVQRFEPRPEPRNEPRNESRPEPTRPPRDEQQHRDEPRGRDEPRQRDDQRNRDGGRPSDFNRGGHRRDEPWRDEPRRDEPRRDEPRRDQPQGRGHRPHGEEEFEPGDNIGNRAGFDTHEMTADRDGFGRRKDRGGRFGRGGFQRGGGGGFRRGGPQGGPRRDERGPGPGGPGALGAAGPGSQPRPVEGRPGEPRPGGDNRDGRPPEGDGERRGRRRRRRRGRGGRGGQDRGPGMDVRGEQRFDEREPIDPRDEIPRGDAADVMPIEHDSDRDIDAGDDAPVNGGGFVDPNGERPLSPSQKRRLRRRRARERRPENGPDGAPIGDVRDSDRVDRPLAETPFDDDAHETDDADDRDLPGATLADELDADVSIDDRAPTGDDELDDDGDGDEFDDDGGDSVELGTATIAESEPDGGARDEVERVDGADGDDRGRRGRGRRGRGGRRDRGGRGGDRGGPRRFFGESEDADSRVYGVRGEEEVYEVEPEQDAASGIGELDRAESVVGDARPATGRKREMIINVARGEECRIAVLEDGRLEQIYLERASAESHVGNIYKGVVTNVEASIQAAFIDFGLGKNGFLHISDLHPMYFPGGEDRTENVGRKLPRKARPPIQKCLRRGQELIVQITKEGIGTKGPTLTTYLSVPGRFLVMMPGMGQLGVSRKIEDEETRRRVKSVLNELELPDDIGFIARTAAEGRSKKELQADLNYLTRLWRVVEKRAASEPAPCEIYRDSDLVIRTIRDVYTTDVQRILIDDADVSNRGREFLGIFSETAAETVVHYDAPEPIFHRFGIEAELERLHSRHVPLRSGGSLVIDQTEALVAIDVNSGRFRAEDDAESTAFRMNMEAADEIPRQLRLRDLGGVIICDFIDMRREENRREVERRLIKNLKQHKERAKVLRMSQFGIIEMTRQRQRGSLTRSVYQDCHHCRGTGLVKTAESVALDVMRLITLASTREHIRSIEVGVSPEVSYMLQNRKRSAIHELENRYRRSISVKPDAAAGLDQVTIQCFDHRGRLVPHS